MPNPYHALDAFGRPACVVMFKPPTGGFNSADHRGYVGAKIDEKRTVVHDLRGPGDIRSPRQDTAYFFDAATPVEVEIDVYYLERLRERSLLPADERSARLAGVAFQAPDEAQAAEKERARELWKAQTGGDLPAEENAK